MPPEVGRIAGPPADLPQLAEGLPEDRLRRETLLRQAPGLFLVPGAAHQ